MCRIGINKTKIVKRKYKGLKSIMNPQDEEGKDDNEKEGVAEVFKLDNADEQGAIELNQIPVLVPNPQSEAAPNVAAPDAENVLADPQRERMGQNRPSAIVMHSINPVGGDNNDPNDSSPNIPDE